MKHRGSRHRPPRALALDAEARAAWESAQELWGVRMADAHLLPGAGDQAGSFAWFSFPPSVSVDPALLATVGASHELESIFAHELGHHVLAPSTRIDGLKITHQMARALVASGAPTFDGVRAKAQQLANMWEDLLVNARLAVLQKRAGTTGAEPGIVRTMRITVRPGFDSDDRLWWVYRRAYELLWNLVPGSLCPADPPVFAPPQVAAATETPLHLISERFREKEKALREARQAAAQVAFELDAAVRSHPHLDADLAAGLVRTFAADPVSGALRFGMLAAPYLLEAERSGAEGAVAVRALAGAPCAADDAPPTAEELGRVLADGRLRAPIAPADGRPDEGRSTQADAAGQGFGVAQTLALYSTSDADAVMAAYYRTEAAPWVRPWVQRRPARPDASLPGPLALWEVGDDVAEIDWAASFRSSAEVVPGVTTRRRTWLEDDPVDAVESIELDVYIDSSGSMPHPKWGSPAVLAGTILALSILRGGGRVRVTSFSGPGQVAGTDRFSRDPGEIVAGLTFMFQGGTSFPLDLYGRRYERLPKLDASVHRHVVVLSDDGLTSMFGRGNEPFETVAATVRSALTTATLVLLDRQRSVAEPAARAGYDVIYLDSMADAPAACARLAEVLHG